MGGKRTTRLDEFSDEFDRSMLRTSNKRNSPRQSSGKVRNPEKLETGWGGAVATKQVTVINSVKMS